MIAWVGHVFHFSMVELESMSDEKVKEWFTRAEYIIKQLYKEH